MRKSAEPVFNMLVEDPKFQDFSVKELREIADRATSALVTKTILAKFKNVGEATVDSDNFEDRLFARIKAAGDAVGDNSIIHDLYMILHLRD